MKALIFLLLYNTGQAQSTCTDAQYCANSGNTTCELSCVQCEDCPSSMKQSACSNCVLDDTVYKKDASSCDPGTFWQPGLKDCEECPAGFYSSSSGADECTICPVGSKCISSTATPCEANEISPLGFEACFSCPTNYEPDASQKECVKGDVTCNSNEYRPYESKCEITPAGYKRLTEDSIERCSEGQYSTQGSTCENCPIGQKCDGYGNNTACDIAVGLSPKTPEGTGGCQHCTRGTDCSTLVACGDGKQWDESSKTCVTTRCSVGPCDGSFQYDCDPGMILNSKSCERCPLKFSASQVNPEVGTCPQIQCPAGYGLDGIDCKICADNYQSDGTTTCKNCGTSENQYCPNKDGGLINCPTGYYKAQPTDITCMPCPAGQSCSSGSQPSLCLSNEYSYEGDSECRSCPPGHECNGSDLKKMCRYGQYLKNDKCTNCPAGSACPNPWETEKPCKCTGNECHYQDSLGQIECKPCPAGQSCDSNSANDCADGEYSLEGQKICTECPAESMCPTKTSPPIPCEPGFYASTKQTECTICGINQSCSKAGLITSCTNKQYSPAGFSECFQCPTGHDCSTGDPVPCKEGEYYDGSQCKSCSAGKFCPIGSNSEITCPVGHFCPAGSFTPSLCPPGTYTTATGLAASTSCTSCGPGYTCDGYTKTICPVGHSCPTSNSPPIPCAEGEYQDETGRSSCKTDVAPGFYCPPGAIECHLCPAGQYCTNGKTSGCAVGKYSEEEGRSSLCVLDCPKGHYCPGGTSSPYPCPPGWYQDSEASRACKSCPAGNSCSSSGLIAPDRNCDHGHYCETTSNYPNSWAPATTWTGGNSSPSKMCSAGKYSVKTNISADTACVTCPSGFYCFPGTGNGLINPIKCPAGYYCEGTKGLEVRDADGNEVDIPFESPTVTPVVYGTKPSWETGSGENYRPRGCLAGTWSNQTGVANPKECWVCEQGWMCTFGTNKLDQGDVNDLIELPAPFAEVQHDTYFEENFFRRRQIDAMACPKGCFCPPGTGFGVTDNFNSELTYDYINEFYHNEYTLQAPQTCPPGSYNDVEGIGRISDCKDCQPGYYCTGTIKDENLGELNRPPLDEYQPGTVVPDACPPGYYNPNYNGVTLADDCPDCPGGWFCPKNATSVPTECGKGKYSNDTATECLDCKPGYYCDNSTTSEKDMLENKKCPPGIDCSENSPDWPISIIPELFQNPCPLGYYCEDVDPVPCPQGTFGGEFGLTSVDECTACTEGYYCPPLADPPSGPGFPTIKVPSCEFDHVSLGNYTCNAYKECIEGHFCVTGSFEPDPCPVSTYQPFPRAKSEDECAPCKSGNYCDKEGLAEPKPCPQGFYCEFNVSTYKDTPCPPGTYGVSESLRSKYECPLCGGGFFCSGTVNGDIVEAPASCDPGFYCSQGAPAPNKNDCEALVLSKSVPGVQCPVVCPQGAYCPKESFTPQPCDEGTYTDSPGKSDKNSDCVPCKSGHFCSGEVLYDSTSGDVFYEGTSGECEGGYFCEQGNIRSNGKISGKDTNPCEEGKRCPVASPAQISCTDGSYQEFELGALCEPCPPGHKCLEPDGTVNPVICESGEYCNTTVVDCPAGTYLDISLLYDSTIFAPFTMGGITEDECKACPIGSYCPIDKTITPEPCEEGFACLGSQIVTNTDINSNPTDCPAGFVCGPETGSKYEVPCQLGTFNDQPGEADSCSPCTAGRVCDKFATVGSTNITHVDCPAGYYCPEGACKIVPTVDPANNVNECEKLIIECPKGYHCPTNSPEAVECPAGMYSDRRLLSVCFDCEPGFYCPGTAFSPQFSTYEDCLNTSNCRLPCPPGSYCDAANMPAPKPCGVGYNNPYEGAIECLPCEAGKACSSIGLANPNEDIEAGYYSISGADSKTPTGLSDVNGPCKNGYICGSGQTLPEPCSEGQESESSSMSEKCVACKEGKFCPKKATESSAGLPCLDGFSCESGCISGNTVVGNECSVCEIGHKCETGLSTNCGNQYQPSEGQSICLVCPAGKDCRSGVAADCPAGHYCESGKNKVQCGSNTFADVAGLHESSECSPCPPGFVCSNDAAPFDTYPQTPCPSASTCPGGTNPVSCSTGGETYCPEGSISDVKIPTGSLEGADDGSLIPCPEKSFCTDNSFALCEDKYECPEGTQFKIPCGRDGTSCFECPENFYCPYDATQNECLPGFLCPEDTAVPTKLCPAGAECNKGFATDCNGAEYNPAEGQSECIECPAGGDCSSTGVGNVDPPACPGGSFCGFGNATESCAAGSYGTIDSTGAQSQEHCHECPYGKYCTGGDNNTPCTNDGKECPIGSATDSPDPCPVGHICKSGKKELCPSGKYPDSGSTTCTDCSSGDYCPGDGSSNDCKEGYFCPTGSDTLRPDNLCPVGKVCPDGSEAAADCLSGEKTIELGSEVCIECAAGYYCASGSLEVECAEGKVCAPGSKDESVTCANGYSSSVEGLTDQAECQECEIGTFCEDGQKQSCTVGCDCQAGSVSDCSNNCPLGSECSSSTALPCPPGHFNGLFGSVTSCSPCVNGEYQDEHGQSACNQFCADGFYCFSGAKSEYPSRLNETDFGICPKGHYCTSGGKEQCQEGTYQDREGQNLCFDCPAGYYCNEKGLEDYVDYPCPIGKFCGRKETSPQDCPAGKYRTTVGARSADECQLCEPGEVCPGTNLVQECPAGYYCFVGAMDATEPKPYDPTIFIDIDGTSSLTVGKCPVGHYCPVGTSLPKSCPAGFYCDEEGMPAPDASKKCPAGMYCIFGAKDNSVDVIEGHKIECPEGFYCPEGTEVPEMCPSGTFRNIKGGVDKENSCSKCHAGYVCHQGQVETDENQCPEGFFCDEGVEDIYARTGSTYDYYCPIGFSCKDGIKEPCPAGTYQAERGQLTCNTCPSGYFCEENPSGIFSPKSCPEGTYCRAGSSSPTKCPVGTFGLTKNLQTESQCTDCLAGYYCDLEGMTQTDVLTKECNAGYLCKPGSAGINGERPGGSDPNRCELGSKCPKASPVAIKCPAGKYNDGSSDTMYVDCAICREDFFCEYSGTIIPVPCPKFYLCPNELSDLTGTGLEISSIIGNTGGSVTPFVCPLYHQCDDGLIATAGLCPENFYREEFEMDPSHTEHCQPCPDGKTCSGGKIEELCAKGNFCVDEIGTIPCPAGSYNPNLGAFLPIDCPDKDIPNLQACAVDQEVCLACPAGYYCTERATRPVPCDAGFYCGENSSDQQENVCPAGNYCPLGTAEPVPCPVGTYLDVTEAGALADCKLCPPKKFCDTTGISQTFSLIDCQEGYFCGAGSPSRTPEVLVDNATTGEYYGPCVEGEYCPSGNNAAPIDCPLGEYNQLIHQGKCSKCPAGYECPGSNAEPAPCSAGYYCPTSEAEPQMCPDGKFNPSTLGYLEKTHCQECPDGKICNGQGLELPTACPAGSYCREGKGTICDGDKLCDSVDQGYEKDCPYGNQCASSNAGPCVAGSYCEDSTAIKCGPGTYCPTENEKYPIMCSPGSTSSASEATSASTCGDCTNGYCPQYGNSDDSVHTVSDGFYCDATSPCGATSTPNSCEPGFICKDGTRSECAGPTEFQSNSEQSECLPCGAGFTCATSTERDECEEGTYCAANDNNKNQCNKGTLGFVSGGSSEKDACRTCPPGYSCDTDGLKTSDMPSRPCPDGFYCEAGSDGTSLPECEVGKFCNGTETAVYGYPCPVSTFSNTPGQKDESDCDPCSVNRYCPRSGLSEIDDFECLAGYDCFTVDENYQPNRPDLICPAGHYCEQSLSASPCDSNFYLEREGATKQEDCDACPAGKDCSTGPGIQEPLENLDECPDGSYCPGSKTLSCNIDNNYGVCDTTGLTDPIPCSDGTILDGGVCSPCQAGKKCYLGMDSSSITIVEEGCDAGFYCENNTARLGEPCPSSTYSSSENATSDLTCDQCLAGSFCVGLGQTDMTGNCEEGYWCEGGNESPRPENETNGSDIIGNACEPGEECDTFSATKCAKGSYQPDFRKGLCEPCPAGFYCNELGTSVPKECPQGNYCPEGTEDEGESCPDGSTGSRPGLEDKDDCTPCAAGKYCNSATKDPLGDPCDPGYYCSGGSSIPNPCQVDDCSTILEYQETCWDNSNLTDTVGGICVPGYYCLGGSARPTPCDAGKSCSKTGLSAPDLGCEPGYYCPTGSITPTEKLCLPGHYCEANSTYPEPCPPGTYDQTQLVDSTERTSDSICVEFESEVRGLAFEGWGNTLSTGVDCEAGWYCEKGTYNRYGDLCTRHHYCPNATYLPIPCPTGQWQPNAGSVSCTDCPAGWFCNETDIGISRREPPAAKEYPKPCEVGYYCPAGTLEQVECPPGTYGNRSRLASEDDCVTCPPGYFCDGGVIVDMCRPGTFCTGGQGPDYALGLSYYLDITDSQRPQYQYPVNSSGICITGTYCPEGSHAPIPCPPGYIGTGSNHSDFTLACERVGEGIYVGVEGGNSDTVFTCQNGFHCGGGAKLSRPYDDAVNANLGGRVCPAGHKCENGTRKACDEGSFQGDEGQVECLECTPGFLCPTTGVILPEVCPAGSYCESGSTNGTECAKNFFNPIEKQSDNSTCYPCKGGYQCNGGNKVDVCELRYYCPEGKGEQLCPSGHLCSYEQSSPEPCETGSYQPYEGKTECEPCQGGHYCEFRGATNVTGPCEGGYYCNGNVTDPRPSQEKCEQGEACPIGAIEPELCNNGTYAPLDLMEECELCPAGYYCDGKVRKSFWRTDYVGVILPTECNEDEVGNIIDKDEFGYCEEGSPRPARCPRGSLVKGYPQLFDSTECEPCPTGSYCEDGDIVDECEEGTFCLASSGSSKPSDQFFDENILSENVVCDTDQLNGCAGKCPPGYLCEKGTILPIPCPQGQKLEGSYKGLFTSDPSCVATGEGEFGVQGYFDSNGKPFPCPEGYYCPATINSTDPIPCPAGTYMDVTGAKTTCIDCPAGYDCTELGLRNYETFICPPGHICLEGEGREMCPNATWRADVGGSNDTIGHEDGCDLCPEGEYCPENVINDAGVPCPPGITCDEGSDSPTELCPAGYYCPESSYHERFPCSAGFYCEAGSWNETVCEFPYYCPPETGEEFGKTCDLGHGALAGLNRTNEAEFCQLCPAGTYRSREEQPECEPCPAGMSCPVGTGQDPREPILCPIGHYCPTGNPLGRPIPCPSGTFSNEVGAQQEACQPCPVDTYNNLEGQAACRLCGTASIAREGSTECQCIGSNRIFQFSDGSCICKQGYESHGYIETDDETEVNKKSDCVAIVNDRCADGFVRDAFTRECITVSDANKNCEESGLVCSSGSAFFDQNYGTCFCPIVDAVEDVPGCCYIPEASVDVATGQLTIDGEEIYDVYGLSPVNNTSAFTVSLSESGVFAELPVNGSVRNRRQAELASSEQIQQPAICVLPGEMVLFELAIEDPRSNSFYPKYKVGSLYNSNPEFDYGAFRTLEAIILDDANKNLNFDKFAYIFEQEGNFVFYSSRDEFSTIIIHVALEGTSCGTGTVESENIRVQPQSERTFSAFGISRTTNINLTPNWPLIASLSFTIVLLILILLIFSTVWSRKDRTFSPWQYWKPKYLATDMPYIFPPLVAKKMSHNLDEDLLDDENQQREDHLTSQELFDRLEDQNLQIASQMQNHQRQLQEYFESMHQEATKLQAFIQKAKEPKQKTGDIKSDKIQKNEFDHVTAIKSRQTVTVQDRTAARALMTTVQQLLNQLNQGRVLVTEEMVDAVLQKKSDKKGGLDASEQEKIIKEEIELVEKVCTIDQDSEDELARIVKEEADLLANAIDEHERNEIIANYAALKAGLQKKRRDDLDRQKIALRQRLVARRRQDLAKKGLSGLDEENDQLIKDMENKTEKMLAEERSGAIQESIDVSKQIHSDKKKRIKAVYMNKMSARVKPESKDQFVIAADNAMDEIEEDFAAKILSDLARVDESGSIEWEEMRNALERDFASDQEIATAKANHEYQLLVEKQAVLENLQTAEIDEISKTLHGLIEKYSTDPDAILNDFNQQMAELEEGSNTEKQRQNQRIQDRLRKLHKDKISEIERDALARLKAMSAIDISGDDELDGQLAQQLAEVADKQASEREELERELAENEAEEQRRLEEELARKQKQTMSELNAKQQAEIEARQGNLTDSQMKMMLLAHSKAQEEAQDALNDKHASQQDALRARLAKMRRDKTMKLESNQEQEMSQEKERIDDEIKEQTRQKQLEAEKEAAMKLIADTGASTEEVIDAIMDRRHRAEIEAFTAAMDEKLSQRLEAATEDGVLPEHAKAKIEHELEVEKAAGLLNLKEKHYQEKLDMLTELAPHAAKNAENDKKKLEKARKKIEEEQAEQERELAAEREKWEAEQKRQMQEEMKSFEAEIDKKLLEEEQRLAAELDEKQQQRERAENEKKQQLEEELAQKLAENAQADHARLLAEHQSQVDKISARQGLDKAKMAEQIKKRLEAKKQIAMKEKQVEVEGEQQNALEDFEKNQVEKISEKRATVEEVEEEEFDGPLTEAQLKKVLAGLPLLGSLNNIKAFLQKSFLDEDVVYGDISPIDISELDKVELCNYNYAIYLLKFFKLNLREGDATRIVISEPIPQSKNEFGTDLYVNRNDLVIRRRVFSTEPGKLAVVLSWAFATAVGEQKKSKGKVTGFIQQVFFQTQSLLMNEAFLLLNSDKRHVPKELTQN